MFQNHGGKWFFLFFIFIVVLGGGTLWHLQKFLQNVDYVIREFTPSTALLHLPPQMPGTVSIGIIFKWWCTCLSKFFYQPVVLKFSGTYLDKPKYFFKSVFL
jgi:hypothetical protein